MPEPRQDKKQFNEFEAILKSGSEPGGFKHCIHSLLFQSSRSHRHLPHSDQQKPQRDCDGEPHLLDAAHLLLWAIMCVCTQLSFSVMNFSYHFQRASLLSFERGTSNASQWRAQLVNVYEFARRGYVSRATMSCSGWEVFFCWFPRLHETWFWKPWRMISCFPLVLLVSLQKDR